MKHLNTNGLETTLEKVARTLSDKFGVNVVFQGDLCCTNGRTIFLPSLPDDLPAEMLMVIRGWLDHEAAHIIFQSDMKIAKEFQRTHGPAAFCVLNILEDARIEAAVSRRFPGSGFNLRMCYAEAAFRTTVAATKAALPLLRQFAFAVHTCVNALPFLDFVGTEVRDLVDELAPLLRQAPFCANTREVAVIALKVWERIRAFVDAEKAAAQKTADAQRGGDQNVSADSSIPGAGKGDSNGKAGKRNDQAADATHQGIIGGMAQDIAQAIGGHPQR